MIEISKAAQQALELEPCPFCGGGTFQIIEKGRMWTGMKMSDPVSVTVRHWCEPAEGQPSRSIDRVGRDEASAISAWNQRAALQDKAGEVRGTPMVQIPDFEDCKAKNESGARLNPLENFVFNNDPAEPEESAGFSVGLAQAIEFAAQPAPVAGPVEKKLIARLDGLAAWLRNPANADGCEALEASFRAWCEDLGRALTVLRSTSTAGHVPESNFGNMPAPVVPDGFAIVPVDPTPEMWRAVDQFAHAGSVWDAMLAASQQKGGSAG